MLINTFFTPMHKAIAETVAPFIFILSYQTYQKIDAGQKDIDVFLVNFFGLVVIIFFSFVYNDMIIIHLCGLETYTKTEILERGTIENQIDIEIRAFGDDNNNIDDSDDEF